MIRLYHKFTYWAYVAAIAAGGIVFSSGEIIQTLGPNATPIDPATIFAGLILLGIAAASVMGSQLAYWFFAIFSLLGGIAPIIAVLFIMPGTRAYAFQHPKLFSSKLQD